MKTKTHPAFTLLEVLLVLVVIGLLAGLAAPVLFGLRDKANVDTTRAQINLFHEACDLYKFQAGDYPMSLEQLTDARALGAGVTEALLESVPLDVWGNEYVYEYRPGMKPDIYSVGKDAVAGTEDDVYRQEK